MPTSTTPLTGNALNRAAEALKLYCEQHRNAVSARADQAEKVKVAGVAGIGSETGSGTTTSWDGGDIYDAVRSAG